ncbi:uncharacterized protein LOC114533326 [Dendronephthya gigantea]|uniref:uncharacterized protein LOC114533326 n=1 Tax=Dendronephthya gigantea TaxID=151771 RepID=UPI00106C4C40|nr:uncharacterized protein LOC114533326 [Dendronephthya gigantea]
MSNGNKDDKGWVFYHLLGRRKVPCNKIKNCKNGGKTVIHLNDGPGSDPYKCKCPKQYEGEFCEKLPNPFSKSKILSGEVYEHQQLLQTWIVGSDSAELCWRASRDGWDAATFHTRCDNKKPTVTFIKVGQYVFGFYVTESWDGSGYKQAPGSFIFSLRNKESLAAFKAPLKYENSKNAMYPFYMYGPAVGGGHDIYIADNAHSSTSSYTNFGSSYEPPHYVNDRKTILAGARKFSPSEVEVFYLP